MSLRSICEPEVELFDVFEIQEKVRKSDKKITILDKNQDNQFLEIPFKGGGKSGSRVSARHGSLSLTTNNVFSVPLTNSVPGARPIRNETPIFKAWNDSDSHDSETETENQNALDIAFKFEDNKPPINIVIPTELTPDLQAPRVEHRDRQDTMDFLLPVKIEKPMSVHADDNFEFDLGCDTDDEATLKASSRNIIEVTARSNVASQ